MLKKKTKKSLSEINEEVKKRWPSQINDDINAASETAIRLGMIGKSLYALDIMLTTCSYFDVSLDDVVGKNIRNKSVYEARLISVYVISENDRCQLNKRVIMKLFNRKSASFVNQCTETVTKLLFHQGHDGKIATAIEAINSRLSSVWSSEE